jgi:hypothetical protein
MKQLRHFEDLSQFHFDQQLVTNFIYNDLSSPLVGVSAHSTALVMLARTEYPEVPLLYEGNPMYSLGSGRIAPGYLYVFRNLADSTQEPRWANVGAIPLIGPETRIEDLADLYISSFYLSLTDTADKVILSCPYMNEAEEDGVIHTFVLDDSQPLKYRETAVVLPPKDPLREHSARFKETFPYFGIKTRLSSTGDILVTGVLSRTSPLMGVRDICLYGFDTGREDWELRMIAMADPFQPDDWYDRVILGQLESLQTLHRLTPQR